MVTGRFDPLQKTGMLTIKGEVAAKRPELVRTADVTDLIQHIRGKMGGVVMQST